MLITEHFRLSEFKCKDGTAYPCKWIDDRLYPLCLDLEKIREKAGSPLIINSGYRTQEYNESVGGAKQSQHLFGRAADIRLPDGVDLVKIIEDLIKEGNIKDGGLGTYVGHCHYDHGPSRRWG